MNCYIDLETGGLDPLKNPILEIGAVIGEEQFVADVIPFPGSEIEREALKVNGWVAPGPQAVTEPDAITNLLGWLRSRGCTHLVAHNVGFEAAFLKAAMSRAGLKIRDIGLRFECTQSMFSLLVKRGEYASRSVSLNAAVNTLLPGTPRNKVHNALEDAILCEGIYKKMTAPVYQQQQQPTQQPTKTPVRSGWGFSSRL